jgi:hypothetical protein
MSSQYPAAAPQPSSQNTVQSASQGMQQNDMQNALFELHSGLMSLKASLLELAQLHEEEVAAAAARVEANKLMARLRKAA